MSAIVLSVEWQVGGGSSEPTLTRLITALERAGAELADVGKHILPKLLPVLEVETGKQYAAEGDGPSGSWAPLTVKYAAWKEAHAGGMPPGLLSGQMFAALTSSSASGAMREVSGNSLNYGTSGIPYASFRQTGTSYRKSGPLRPGQSASSMRGPTRMPARPVFDFGPDLEDAMRSAAMAGVREAVRAAGDGLLDFEGDTFEGQSVLTGRSGGRYVVGSNGGKTYLRQGPSGVVKRTFGGKP